MNPTQQPASPWLSLKEAAEYLGVTKATVRKYIAGGHLHAAKLGHRTVRVSALSIERMMDAASQEAK